MGRTVPEKESAPASLVTPDMEEHKGVWGQGRSSYPISLSDIRKWAIAVYWPEPPPPLFWDEEYAATTRWGGIVAPQDFNPFAWPVERAAPGAPARPRPPRSADGRRPMGIMNGGQTDTYGVPMRPGDVITSRSRLRDWQERDTRLGHTLFIYNETEWTNQADELVKRRVSTTIRY
jgi:acyl dehydratase